MSVVWLQPLLNEVVLAAQNGQDMISLVEELRILSLLINISGNVEYLLLGHGSCLFKIKAVQINLIVGLKTLVDLIEHLPSDVPSDLLFLLLDFFRIKVSRILR